MINSNWLKKNPAENRSSSDTLHKELWVFIKRLDDFQNKNKAIYSAFQFALLLEEEHNLRCFSVHLYLEKNTVWDVSLCTLILRGTQFEVFQRAPLFEKEHDLRCFSVDPYFMGNTIWGVSLCTLIWRGTQFGGVSVCTFIWRGTQSKVFQCAPVSEKEHNLKCFSVQPYLKRNTVWGVFSLALVLKDFFGVITVSQRFQGFWNCIKWFWRNVDYFG